MLTFILFYFLFQFLPRRLFPVFVSPFYLRQVTSSIFSFTGEQMVDRDIRACMAKKTFLSNSRARALIARQQQEETSYEEVYENMLMRRQSGLVWIEN